MVQKVSIYVCIRISSPSSPCTVCDLTKSVTFCDSFDSTIHSNPSLLNVGNSGDLRTGTPISEHDFSFNFSHHISRILHDMDKKVSPEDRSIISLTAN